MLQLSPTFSVPMYKCIESLIMFSDCGVHQKLDIVILYDESSSVGLSYFNNEIAFIGMLADALYIHANHTNIAGIGADHQAHYRWGLTDYFTSFDITANLYNITMAYGLSDLAPGIDMAWNNILSKNLRSGSTPWLFIITDTAYMTSTTSLDAVKAAGIKVGFLTTLSASTYTSYASDSRYIVAGMSWSTITTYVSQVVTTLFCPACMFSKLISLSNACKKLFSNFIARTCDIL